MDELNNDVIVENIIDEPTEEEMLKTALSEVDVEKTKQLIQLFNVSESKKSMIRINKLNTLYDNITTQMLDRFAKYPNNFSNDDLVKYLKVTQDAIEKTTNLMNKSNETPAIQLQQNNQVNITVNNGEGQGLNRESRDRILDVVKSILKQNQITSSVKQEDNQSEDDDDVLSEDLYRIDEDNE